RYIDIAHGRYLRAGAAKEDLIGDIELRAVDGALHDLQVELSAQQLDHGESGQTFQDVVRGGRCKHLTVADQEDVLGAAFADMTVVGQHDRLVEAVFHGLGLGERGVDVDAGDLGPCGCRIVVNASPARHHAANATLDVDVIPEGADVNGEGILEVMETDADLFRTLESDRSDVNVLSEVVALDEIDAGGAQLIQADRDLEL